MKKRIGSLLLSLALCLTLLPTTAEAVTTKVRIARVSMGDGSAVQYYTNGTDGADGSVSGTEPENSNWNAKLETKDGKLTLTLKGFLYNGAANGITVETADDLYIVLEGTDNRITINSSGSQSRGISTLGNLTISGTSAAASKLTITNSAGQHGIYARCASSSSWSTNKTITIENATIDASGATSAGIEADGIVTINDSVVTASGTNYGIKGSSISISNSTITASATGGSGTAIDKVSTINGNYQWRASNNGAFADYDESSQPTFSESYLELKPTPTATTHSSHPICGSSCDCDSSSHSDVTAWTAWTSADALPTTAGYYYLTNDVTLKGTWTTPTGDTTLCLNGHTITGADGKDTIKVEENNTFTLTDCKNTGTITHASSATGCGVYVERAAFHLYGGTIRGNTASADNAKGGGVCVVGSTSADNPKGTFTMSGGQITQNAANSTSNGGGGGGVYLSGHSAFTMTGGTITGNTTNRNGGGVCVGSNASFAISGSAQVKDNCKDSAANNVYLPDAKTITVSGVLDSAARIGVTTATELNGANTSIPFAAGSSGYTLTDADKAAFAYDKNNVEYSIQSENNTLSLNYGHNWTYASVGTNGIKATCSSVGCTTPDGGTVTIVAPTGELTYDGQAKPATLSGSFASNVIPKINYDSISGDTESPLENDASPTDAGTYRAKIKMGNVTGYVDYTIAPKTLTKDDLEYTGADITKTYDGSTSCDLTAVSVKSGVLCGSDTLEITGTAAYDSANVYEASKVIFTPAAIETGNYILAATETLEIPAHITSKTVTPTVTIDGGSTYDGTAKTPDVTVIADSKTLVRDTDYTVAYDNNVNAGADTASVTVTAKADRNYTWTPVEQNFSIEKADPVPPTGLFGKTGAMLSTVDLPTGWTWVNGDAVMSAEGEQPFAARYAGTSNYNAKDSVDLTVNVSHKEPKTLTVSMTGWTYGETASEPQYTKPADATNLKVEYRGAADTAYTTDVPTNAGDYTVRVSYETATEIWIGTADFTISKAKLTDPTFETVTNGETWLSEVGWSTNAFADLSWDVENVLVEQGKSYTWTLTADPNNYDPASISGSVVLWPNPSITPSGGGGGGSSSGTTVTVPVSSDSGSVNVKVEVKKGNASVAISDKQISQVIADGASDVTLDVSGLKNVTSATVPSRVVEKTNEAENTGLTVALPAGSVTLDETALTSVTENADGKDVTISVVSIPTANLSQTIKDIIGMEPTVTAVVDVNVYVNGQKQSSFDGGKITISIPYTPKSGEDTSKLTVWFIRDDGRIENKGGYYDAEKKCFVFETEHLSQYLLVSTDAPVLPVFTDVPDDAYYADAVTWAVLNGITTGMTETTFGPDLSCTRAQVVTFLWRAAGEPEPTGNANPFTDVTESDYFYSAVLWAVETGITTGVTDTTFAPSATCTRAQAAAFLYRNEQANGGGFTGSWMFKLPFTDVPEWCYEAVAWCYMNGITQGTSETTFSPNHDCTRAQIVTMLYRLLGE